MNSNKYPFYVSNIGKKNSVKASFCCWNSIVCNDSFQCFVECQLITSFVKFGGNENV